MWLEKNGITTEAISPVDIQHFKRLGYVETEVEEAPSDEENQAEAAAEREVTSRIEAAQTLQQLYALESEYPAMPEHLHNLLLTKVAELEAQEETAAKAAALAKGGS